MARSKRSKKRRQVPDSRFTDRSRGYWPTTQSVRPSRSIYRVPDSAFYDEDVRRKTSRRFRADATRNIAKRLITRAIKKQVFKRLNPWGADQKGGFSPVLKEPDAILRQVKKTLDVCNQRRQRRAVILASGNGGSGFKKPIWTKKSYRSCK